jgi:hypothetical protein
MPVTISVNGIASKKIFIGINSVRFFSLVEGHSTGYAIRNLRLAYSIMNLAEVHFISKALRRFAPNHICQFN